MANQNSATAAARPSREHLAAFRNSAVCAAVTRALSILVPSGNRAEMRALFDGRVTAEAIDHWRAGRRRPSQWARDRLRAKLLELAAVAEAIGDADPPPDNTQALLRWHARQAAEKRKAAQ
jgi:hypothetical protein